MDPLRQAIADALAALDARDAAAAAAIEAVAHQQAAEAALQPVLVALREALEAAAPPA